MAAKIIKGITIEFGGDTTELQKALQKPEKDARNLQSELREINNSLKFNPNSLELLAQKSTVLGQEVAAVSEKLKILKDSQAEVAAQAARGDIGEEQYRAFQREILKTEDQLRGLQNQLIDNDKLISTLSGNTKSAADSAKVFAKAVDGSKKSSEEAKKSSEDYGKSVRKLKSDFQEAESGATSFSNIVKGVAVGDLISSGIQKATSALWDFASAGAESAQTFEVNERKLEQVLRNTINASDEYLGYIKALIEEEERLGVVSKNSQTAAAQELATYVSRSKSLEALLPLLNDITVQQYGVNASQQEATTVATALGKALQGQYDGLSRWGYAFSDAEKAILGGNNELRKLDVLLGESTESIRGINYELRDTTDAGRQFGQSLEIRPAQEKFGKNVEAIKTSLLSTLLPAFNEAIDAIDEGVVKNAATFENLGNIIATIINAFTNLIKVITAIPAPVLALIGGVLLAIKTFVTVTKGIDAFSNALNATNPPISGTMIKIIALIAAVSVLLFLILALKEGTDKASKAISDMGNVASQATNAAQQGAPRGYASGTQSAARGLAWVGENGPELVNFRGGERVYTAAQSREMAGGGIGSAVQSYTDNSSLVVYTNDDDVMREVKDWWAHRQIRTRAQGGV